MQVVEDFNANPDVHGILVQLPLPKHIEEKKILDAISLEKDVDGFHPFNIGSLAMRGRDPLFVSCTPKVLLPHPFLFDTDFTVSDIDNPGFPALQQNR